LVLWILEISASRGWQVKSPEVSENKFTLVLDEQQCKFRRSGGTEVPKIGLYCFRYEQSSLRWFAQILRSKVPVDLNCELMSATGIEEK
jgi:hypothetical protein